MYKSRKSMSNRKSTKYFSKTASRVHPKNVVRPMRGGYRL